MNLVSVGISHHTAAVDVREKMWLSDEETREALARLKERYFAECVVVSTCNRTELYGIARGEAPPEEELKASLIGIKAAGSVVRPEHFVGRSAGGAVGQLFKVAAGIDSLVVGDIQILGQVKDAFALARDAGALGPVLNRLMQSALHVGKRVRSETAVCEGAVSVSYAAVELASKIFADLARRSALLVGAGETGELALTHLAGRGVGQIRVANRTRGRAAELAQRFGGEVVDFDRLLEAVRTVDIMITSVAAPAHVLQADELQRLMRQRSNNPLFIIDIGVPRNVDPAARRVENVFLYDIDALGAIVDRNLEKRRAEIPRVGRIIEEEMASFFAWYNALQVGPTIQQLRERVEAIRHEEVERNVHRFRAEDRELLELVTRRIVNKILHGPMTVLRQGAGEEDAGETVHRVKALRDLFGMWRGGGGGDHG